MTNGASTLQILNVVSTGDIRFINCEKAAKMSTTDTTEKRKIATLKQNLVTFEGFLYYL
jgi:hypothetical protein